MKIGDLVWNRYNGLLRFGTVINKQKKEGGWMYFIVDWHDDECYSSSMEWRKELCGEDPTLKEYRVDQIKTISADRLKQVLKEHNVQKEKEI